MTQQSTDRYALVTGASRGLGKAIAIELSRRGYPTILVSRSDKVLEVCKEITSQYGLPSVGFMADLTDPRSIDSLAEQVNANYQVFMLINNAGVGGTRRFVEASTHYLENILDLNTKGTALLTHTLLPNLLRQPQAYILNIGSMAAHTPTGFKTVYPASKAFIHHFSLGLREELKDTPVSVSVCSPGAMATNDEVTARSARARADVDDLIRPLHGLLVVLDDDEGIAEVRQPAQRIQQFAVVLLVQADGGFVEDIHDPDER